MPKTPRSLRKTLLSDKRLLRKKEGRKNFNYKFSKENASRKARSVLPVKKNPKFTQAEGNVQAVLVLFHLA